MKQLELEDFFSWKQEPIPIGVLKITWKDIETECGIVMKTDHDDLDTFKYAILQSHNHLLYYLHSYQNSQIKEPNKLTVNLQAGNLKPTSSLYRLVDNLNYSRSIIEWINPYFAFGKKIWQLKTKISGKEYIVLNIVDEVHAVNLVKSSQERDPLGQYWYEAYEYSDNGSY